MDNTGDSCPRPLHILLFSRPAVRFLAAVYAVACIWHVPGVSHPVFRVPSLFFPLACLLCTFCNPILSFLRCLHHPRGAVLFYFKDCSQAFQAVNISSCLRQSDYPFPHWTFLTHAAEHSYEVILAFCFKEINFQLLTSVLIPPTNNYYNLFATLLTPITLVFGSIF